MELKHLLSDINDLRIHKSNNNLSEWGEDKLKEYEFILAELAELKKLRVTDVSGRSELLNCDHEWRVEKFDCYGFPAEKYCDKCGKIEAV